MKILFLTDNFPPEVNAPASRTYEHVCEWKKWGHTITVITCFPNFPQGKVYAGYKNQWCKDNDIPIIRIPYTKLKTLNIDDLKLGMKLQGTVRNVVDFGAFIDIGLHNDGLVHISKISKEYIKHPSEVLSVGDIVDCYVIEIFKEKEKVALSLIKDLK